MIEIQGCAFSTHDHSQFLKDSSCLGALAIYNTHLVQGLSDVTEGWVWLLSSCPACSCICLEKQTCVSLIPQPQRLTGTVSFHVISWIQPAEGREQSKVASVMGMLLFPKPRCLKVCLLVTLFNLRKLPQPLTYRKNVLIRNHKNFILKQLFGIQIIYCPLRTKTILHAGRIHVLVYFDIKNKIFWLAI